MLKKSNSLSQSGLGWLTRTSGGLNKGPELGYPPFLAPTDFSLSC